MNSSNLKNKIQSKQGATIVFALVALIVCLMISAVVIYTAFSNVGRVKNTQGEEQNYLAVSSALMMFKNALEGDSVSFEQTFITTTEEVYDDNWDELLREPTIVTEELPLGAAVYNDIAAKNTIPQEVLNAWAKAIIDPPASQTELTITITGNGILSEIATVEAEMVFNPQNQKLTITFGIENASPSAVMTMDLLKATSYPVTSSSEKKELIDNENVKTITVTKKVVHTISWDNFVITKNKTSGG